jgi:precorrin isomerase
VEFFVTGFFLIVDYIKSSQEIYDLSFATIRNEANLTGLPGDLEKVLVRMIHGCGMVDIAANFDFSPGAVSAGRAALRNGCPILCDSNMLANGITRARLPANNAVICTLRNDEVPQLAAKLQNTRSAAALELWHEHMDGAVVAVGNAPTALFRLLELLGNTNWPRPALIVGIPVGFVGAIEAKRELASNPLGAEFITLHGRVGGSAITASAINAIADERE